MCVHVCVCVMCVSSPHRYQHSRHLVNALNKLAATDADLPDGWEKKLNQQGKASGCGYVRWMKGGCGSVRRASGCGSIMSFNCKLAQESQQLFVIELATTIG